MPELHCLITGRVQGVAFRSFVENMAREMKLTGFVANLPDGSVEVLAQGDLTVLKVFANHLRVGPTHAKVAQVYEDWREGETTFSDFSVY